MATATKPKVNNGIDVDEILKLMKSEETRGAQSTVRADLESLKLSASPVHIYERHTGNADDDKRELTNIAQNATNYINKTKANMRVVRRISAGKVYVWDLSKLTPAQAAKL